jgi:3-deoxy-D-arabino-heptulosonate 7-phosphate (DAHP) synthase class II
MAGQFAKPRSLADHEDVKGMQLLSYRVTTSMEMVVI